MTDVKFVTRIAASIIVNLLMNYKRPEESRLCQQASIHDNKATVTQNSLFLFSCGVIVASMVIALLM